MDTFSQGWWLDQSPAATRKRQQNIRGSNKEAKRNVSNCTHTHRGTRAKKGGGGIEAVPQITWAIKLATVANMQLVVSNPHNTGTNVRGPAVMLNGLLNVKHNAASRRRPIGGQGHPLVNTVCTHGATVPERPNLVEVSWGLGGG